MLCDSLEIEPRPNNGTIRLPLKPVGLHSDPDAPSIEDANDLPSTSIPSTRTSTSKQQKPTATHTTVVIEPTPSSPVDDTADKNPSDEDEKEFSSFFDEVVNTIGDTLGSFGDWVSGLFGSDDKES